MIRYQAVASVLAALTAALTVGGSAGASASAVAAAPTTAPAGSWNSVPLPGSVVSPSRLTSITAVSPASAWAAGYSGSLPLMLHWDGSNWAPQSLPSVDDTTSSDLEGVSAAGLDNAWGYGINFFAPAGVGSGFLIHWNGGSWVDVPLPSGIAGFEVKAISAEPGGGVWVMSNGGTQNVLAHWDGHAWTFTDVPADIDAIHAAASGVCAAGGVAVGPEILRWDGTRWTVIPGPSSGPGDNSFTDVLAVSPRDVWASGSYCAQTNAAGQCTAFGAQLAHWNGARWDVVEHQPAFAGAETLSPDRLGNPQWAGLSVPDATSASYDFFNGATWSPVTGAAMPAGRINTVTAHIPGTNATWSTVNDGVLPVVAINYGTAGADARARLVTGRDSSR